MTDLLLGNTNAAYQQVSFDDEGANNVERLLDALEMIVDMLEKPNLSIFWLDIDSARRDGTHPSPFKFPSIIGNHFPMFVKDFLNGNVEESNFVNFENDCLQSCVRLEYEQVSTAYSKMLTLYKLTRM